MLCLSKKLIEPGGYLQWDELDIGNNKVVSSDPSIADTFAGKLLDQLAAVSKKRNWDLRLVYLPRVLLYSSHIERSLLAGYRVSIFYSRIII